MTPQLQPQPEAIDRQFIQRTKEEEQARKEQELILNEKQPFARGKTGDIHESP